MKVPDALPCFFQKRKFEKKEIVLRVTLAGFVSVYCFINGL